MPKPPKKKTPPRPMPRRERHWKMAVVTVLCVSGIWKVGFWAEAAWRNRDEVLAPYVKLAERSIKPRSIPGLRVRLICYHDAKWGGSNYLFIDRGFGPVFVCNMDERDENLGGLARVVLTKDEKGVIVRSHNAMGYSGGCHVLDGRIFTIPQAETFAQQHGLSSNDLFLSGAPLQWRAVKVRDLKAFKFEGPAANYWRGQMGHIGE